MRVWRMVRSNSLGQRGGHVRRRGHCGGGRPLRLQLRVRRGPVLRLPFRFQWQLPGQRGRVCGSVHSGSDRERPRRLRSGANVYGAMDLRAGERFRSLPRAVRLRWGLSLHGLGGDLCAGRAPSRWSGCVRRCAGGCPEFRDPVLAPRSGRWRRVRGDSPLPDSRGARCARNVRGRVSGLAGGSHRVLSSPRLPRPRRHLYRDRSRAGVRSLPLTRENRS